MSSDRPGKARRRTPDNRADFASRIVRLNQEGWRHEGGNRKPEPKFDKVAPGRVVFYEALTRAITLSTAGAGCATLAEWEAQCIRSGLMEAQQAGLKDDIRKKAWRTAKGELCGAKWIAIDGDQIRDLRNRYS